VDDDAPCAVLWKDHRSPRGADEDGGPPDALRGVDVDATHPHALAAARDLDLAVHGSAERAELRAEQLSEQLRRDRFAARAELHVAEHAAGRDAPSPGAAHEALDLDVGVEVHRLQVDLRAAFG